MNLSRLACLLTFGLLQKWFSMEIVFKISYLVYNKIQVLRHDCSVWTMHANGGLFNFLKVGPNLTK